MAQETQGQFEGVLTSDPDWQATAALRLPEEDDVVVLAGVGDAADVADRHVEKVSVGGGWHGDLLRAPRRGRRGSSPDASGAPPNRPRSRRDRSWPRPRIHLHRRRRSPAYVLVMSRSRSKVADMIRQPSPLPSSSAAARPMARPSVGRITLNAMGAATTAAGRLASVPSCCATRKSPALVEIATPIQIDQPASSGVKSSWASRSGPRRRADATVG